MEDNHLQKAIQIVQKKTPSVVSVFDLDSTLFCMKYRTMAILKDSFKNLDSDLLTPETLNKLNKIEVTERDWAVSHILKKYDINDKKVLKFVTRFWSKQFHSGTYLHFDKPYLRAPEFVNHLQQLGSSIFYLTAREEFMREASIKSLHQWNFPLETNEHLIMKDADKSSEEYKKEALEHLYQKFSNVLFFENEPVILNFVYQHLKNVHLFWIDSTHSGEQTPMSQINRVPMDYPFQHVKL